MILLPTDTDSASYRHLFALPLELPSPTPRPHPTVTVLFFLPILHAYTHTHTHTHTYIVHLSISTVCAASTHTSPALHTYHRTPHIHPFARYIVMSASQHTIPVPHNTSYNTLYLFLTTHASQQMPHNTSHHTARVVHSAHHAACLAVCLFFYSLLAAPTSFVLSLA